MNNDQSLSRKELVYYRRIDAVAQVMTRNMSHNIGSHVLSHLIGNDAYSLFSDENIRGTPSPYIPLYDDQQLGNSNLQLAHFIQYLKNRMDYLGEVTLNVPNMLTTKYIYSDVFKDFDRQRILLKYISGVTDFRYRFCLKHNGKLLSEHNDIAVAFSSDMLGTQAFFNIIENVIRNTAKHSRYKNQGDVNVITIEFQDVTDYPNHYRVEIDNGINEDNIHDLVKKQNNLLKEDLLDKDNKLRTYGLGVVEMEASAAFLRQVEISDKGSKTFGRKSDSPILLEAFNKGNSLAYRFYMQKPKEFLFVGDWDVDEDRKKEMANIGLRFVGEEDFLYAMKQGVSFPHPFLFYRMDASDNVKKLLSDESLCKTLLTIRKLQLDEEEINLIANIICESDIGYIVSSLKNIAWTMFHEKIITKELKNPQNNNVEILTALDPETFNQVVFLNHSSKNDHERNWGKAHSASEYEVWIENLSSRTSAKLPFFSKYSVGECDPVPQYVDSIRNIKSIKYEIFEAYHNRVVVIDERIQRFSANAFEGSFGKEGGPLPCSELFKSTNVLIPDIKNIPLDENFNPELKARLKQFIDDNIDNAFLLVHYGILERMYEEVDNNVKANIINSKSLNKWAKKAKRVVVTSGRGAHSLTLPPSVCFADHSSVMYAFEGSSRNKFTINDLLNQSRRKYNKKNE